jgi:hypothetical protein
MKSEQMIVYNDYHWICDSRSCTFEPIVFCLIWPELGLPTALSLALTVRLVVSELVHVVGKVAASVSVLTPSRAGGLER